MFQKGTNFELIHYSFKKNIENLLHARTVLCSYNKSINIKNKQKQYSCFYNMWSLEMVMVSSNNKVKRYYCKWEKTNKRVQRHISAWPVLVGVRNSECMWYSGVEGCLLMPLCSHCHLLSFLSLTHFLLFNLENGYISIL